MNTNEEIKEPTPSAKSNPLTDGVIWKQLLLYFFPILLGSFFQQLYNTVDTIVVGRFVGTQALASVGGSAYQITGLILYFFVGLSSGATILIAQHIGAAAPEKVHKHLHNAYGFCLVGGIVFTIIGIYVTPHLLTWMNTDPSLMAGSTLYLRIFFGGILFSFIYNMGAGILRAAGDSKRPLYFLIICCFLNIIFDIVLVLVIPLGIAGVALATVLAQAISAVLVTRTLMKEKDILHLQIRKICITPPVLKEQLRLGIPAAVNAIMYCLSNIIVQSAVNTFGTDTVAAYVAFGKLESIYWMVLFAFGTAISTFVGQNYGAKKFDRIHKSVRICTIMCLSISVVILSVLLIGREPLFHLFSSDENVIIIGIHILELLAPCYLLYLPVEICSSTLRGMGNVLVPTIITLAGICFLRIFWVLFIVPFRPELNTLLINYPISWGATGLFFLIYYIWYWKKQKAK